MKRDEKQDYNKHVLITGASSGIGHALAVQYAAPGVLLSLSGRNQERLAYTAEECRDKGADVAYDLVDVIDQQAMRDWVIACDDKCTIDLIIANAGISAGTGGDGENERQVRQIFDVNVNGVFNTVWPLLPRMYDRKQGQVAIMSSIAGYRGWPGAPAYCASKAAVKTYGESLRIEAARHGVRVNVICPGFVKSPMTDVNQFPMPFLMSAQKAAGIIQRGLRKNRGRIAFPLPMVVVAWFFASLPEIISSQILRITPKK